MRFFRLANVVVAAGLVGCGGGGGGGYNGGTTAPPPAPGGSTPTLGSISTNVSSMSLVAGNSQQITVTAYDAQGYAMANAGYPSFVSASSGVAEVDGSGNVLGLTNGATTITASLSQGSVTKTASVTVNVTGVLPNDANVIASSGDYTFTPKNVAISRGGTVTWTFGGVEHTVTFTATAGAPASIISGGYSTAVSRTFTAAGNFVYNCTIHAGMSGQIVVR